MVIYRTMGKVTCLGFNVGKSSELYRTIEQINNIGQLECLIQRIARKVHFCASLNC